MSVVIPLGSELWQRRAEAECAMRFQAMPIMAWTAATPAHEYVARWREIEIWCDENLTPGYRFAPPRGLAALTGDYIEVATDSDALLFALRWL